MGKTTIAFLANINLQIWHPLVCSHSILYADIVGFTCLASDCSPGEPVHMLMNSLESSIKLQSSKY